MAEEDKKCPGCGKVHPVPTAEELRAAQEKAKKLFDRVLDVGVELGLTKAELVRELCFMVAMTALHGLQRGSLHEMLAYKAALSATDKLFEREGAEARFEKLRAAMGADAPMPTTYQVCELEFQRTVNALEVSPRRDVAPLASSQRELFSDAVAFLFAVCGSVLPFTVTNRAMYQREQ